MIALASGRRDRFAVAPVLLATLLLATAVSGCYRPKPLALPSAGAGGVVRAGEGVRLDAGGGSAAPATITVSEDEAVRLALEKNERLDIVRRRVDAAAAELKSAGRLKNPEVRVEELNSDDLEVGRLRTIEVGFRWRSPKPGELSAEKDVASSKAGLAQVELELYKHQLALEVRKTCVEIAALTRLVEIYEKRLELAKSKLSVIEKQIELGERTSLELARARLEIVRIGDDHARLVRRLESQKVALAALIGFDGRVEVKEIEEKRIDGTVGDLVARAHRNRPELQRIAREYQESQARYHLERTKAIPWFSFVELSYHGEYNEPDGRNEEWVELQFGFDLPIFNSNSGNIEAERIRVTSRSREFELLKREIERQVADAYSAYRKMLTELEAYEKEAATAISDAKRVLDEAQRSDAVDPLETIRLELRILDIEESLVERRRDLSLSRIELLSAASMLYER